MRMLGGRHLDEDAMDNYLRQLRQTPPDRLLAGLDERVMGALVVRRKEAGMAQRFMVLAALISLGGGALAGVSTGEHASAARPLSPFAPATALAPSTLLDPR